MSNSSIDTSRIDTKPNPASSTDKAAHHSDKQSSAQSIRHQENTETSSLTPLQKSRKEFNAAILQANHDVSLGVKNEPLALVYKTAIDAINKELETDFGANSIERGYDQGLDVSPEATAERILSFSTGLFSLYQQQHPEISEQEQAEKFVEIIGGGIETGFTEARDILDGLGVLEGEIAENIDKTFSLVQEGLLVFLEKFTPDETAET